MRKKMLAVFTGVGAGLALLFSPVAQAFVSDPADETHTHQEWESRITVDMDVLSERCGTDGQYVVKFRNLDGAPDGRVVTQVVTDCP